MRKILMTSITLFLTCILGMGVTWAYPPGYSFEQTGTGFADLSTAQALSPNTSAKLATVTTDDRAAIVFNGGPQLSTINQLSYSTYTVRAGTYGQLTAWVSIYLHAQPGKSYDDWVTDYLGGSSDVFYIQAEPIYTTGNPVLNTWETQDAFGGTPLKWVGLESPDAPYSAPTLSDYISGAASPTYASQAYGSLYVVAIKIRMGYGGPWVDTLAYVDNVTINDYFETFEPSSFELKQQVNLDLLALLPTGDDKTDKSINKAVDSINKSLNPTYWVDGNQLSSGGKKVFDEEKKAVKQLMKIKAGPAEVDDAIATLVAIDGSLAQIALDEAIAGSGDPSYISKAESEMAKADDEIAKGKFDKAIDHYKKAWENALKA